MARNTTSTRTRERYVPDMRVILDDMLAQHLNNSRTRRGQVAR